MCDLTRTGSNHWIGLTAVVIACDLGNGVAFSSLVCELRIHVVFCKRYFKNSYCNLFTGNWKSNNDSCSSTMSTSVELTWTVFQSSRDESKGAASVTSTQSLLSQWNVQDFIFRTVILRRVTRHIYQFIDKREICGSIVWYCFNFVTVKNMIGCRRTIVIGMLLPHMHALEYSK